MRLAPTRLEARRRRASGQKKFPTRNRDRLEAKYEVTSSYLFLSSSHTESKMELPNKENIGIITYIDLGTPLIDEVQDMVNRAYTSSS
ncbi:MAG TPA: hypothetical protein VHU91_10515 [Mycobacteriales bacterium]|nr:hypothetical protein [Mycobacteriales bacterium]